VKIKYRDDLSCGEHYSSEQMMLAFPFQKEEQKPAPVIKPVERKWK
jgi:hypothetical protein